MTRQIAICNTAVQRQMDNGEKLQKFHINTTSIPCGLIETKRMSFDPEEAANLDKVFVRKKGFSCNYRDKSLALGKLEILQEYGLKRVPKFYSLGSEFSGEVVAVGANIKDFTIGDRVMSNSNYPAEHPDANPGLPSNNGSKEYDKIHFSKLIKIPANMSWEVASCFQIGGQTTYSMIRKLGVKAGDKVLISGATSNTSLFAINALKKYDVEVYALTTRDTFKKQLLAMGVKEVFVVDITKPLYQNPQIQQHLKQHGAFSVAIDPFCDLYLDRMVDLLEIGGRYATCGLFNQHRKMANGYVPPNNLTETIVKGSIKNITIIGNCLGSTQDLQNALDDYEKGELEVVLDTTYTGNQIEAFFDRTFNAKERFGKVTYLYS